MGNKLSSSGRGCSPLLPPPPPPVAYPSPAPTFDSQGNWNSQPFGEKFSSSSFSPPMSPLTPMSWTTSSVASSVASPATTPSTSRSSSSAFSHNYQSGSPASNNTSISSIPSGRKNLRRKLSRKFSLKPSALCLRKSSNRPPTPPSLPSPFYPAAPTPSTVAINAIAHASSFGGRGSPPQRSQHERAVAPHPGSPAPMLQPEASGWGLIVPRAEVGRLMRGFTPAGVEDKWHVWADGPTRRGEMRVHMVRSWTGRRVVELGVKIYGHRPEAVVVDGFEVWQDQEECGGDAVVEEIVWESCEEVVRGQDEDRAKSTACEVMRWVLGMDVGEGR